MFAVVGTGIIVVGVAIVAFFIALDHIVSTDGQRAGVGAVIGRIQIAIVTFFAGVDFAITA